MIGRFTADHVGAFRLAYFKLVLSRRECPLASGLITGFPMRLIKLFLLMLVMMLGAVFAVLNADPVQFNYYFGSRELPLSLVLTIALGVGVLLGIFACMGLMFGMKRENLQLRRKSQLVSQEVNNLRALPLKDR